MSAADKVLHTYELLECILFHTCVDGIIMSTQVCCYWQDLIRSSSRLRHRIFVEKLPGTKRSRNRKRKRCREANGTWLFRFVQPHATFVVTGNDFRHQLVHA